MRDHQKKESPKDKKQLVKKLDDSKIEIQEKEKRLLDLKIDLKIGKLKNPNEIRKIRREIARLKTRENLKRFIRKEQEGSKEPEKKI